MVKHVLFSLLFVGLLTGCEKFPGYGDSITVNENGAVWEVKLNKAFHNEKAVWVELEYANRSGAAFTVKPANVVLRDDQGNFWVADGRFPLIKLLTPGETQKVRVSYSDAVVSKRPLFLSPLDKLLHKAPVFLLKAEGDVSLPGNHVNERWDALQ